MSKICEMQVLGFFFDKRDGIKEDIKSLKDKVESKSYPATELDITNIKLLEMEDILQDINKIISIMRGDNKKDD